MVSPDPVKIDNTCISIFGGVQPGILKSFAKGKVQNGFMDRWIFAFPDKVPYPKLKVTKLRITSNLPSSLNSVK